MTTDLRPAGDPYEGCRDAIVWLEWLSTWRQIALGADLFAYAREQGQSAEDLVRWAKKRAKKEGRLAKDIDGPILEDFQSTAAKYNDRIQSQLYVASFVQYVRDRLGQVQRTIHDREPGIN